MRGLASFLVVLIHSEAVTVLMASSLAAMLPISIGGWGVREGATALALVAFGASVGDAAAASVLSGVGLLVIGAVGAAAWLTHNLQAAARFQPASKGALETPSNIQ